MSDPKRWLDDPSAPGGAVHLLSALRAPDDFPTSAEESIRTRLSATLANAPAAAAASKLGSFKLAAAGAAVVGVGVLVAYLAGVGRGPSPAIDAPRPVAAALPSTAPEVLPPPNPIATAETPAEPERASEPSKAPPARASATREDSLHIEESLLEQARKAADGSPGTALSLLREHERRFPAGELTAERLFLMAKTYARSGNEAAAKRYGRELERRFPKSAYLRELRLLLPSLPPASSAEKR